MDILDTASCADATSSINTPIVVTPPLPEINCDDNKKMDITKDDTENNADGESCPNSIDMGEEGLVSETSGSSNTSETAPWPRFTRRSTRNYRHSLKTDDCDNEEEVDEPIAANSSAGQEHRPLLAESPPGADRAADPNNAAVSAPSAGNSPPASSSNRATSRSSDSESSSNSSPLLDDDIDIEKNEVTNKPKPPYTWRSTIELMHREHGLSGHGRRSLGTGIATGFNARFYASRHVVERMKISHCLLKHSGCVNCLNFNRSGDLLCSGSDDTRIIIWNWSKKKPKYVIKSGHSENIFQTKFVNSEGVLDIVSAGRDGQVRRSILSSSGGKPQTSLLYRHNGSVHKLIMSPNNPFEIFSAGEDAHIRLKDLRSDETATSICKVENSKDKRKVRLYSISHHPYAPEICVCGCDNFVHIYDKRSMSKPVHQMCPDHLLKASVPQITCAVYNSTGSEVLASYSNDHIYLFNNNVYKTGEYLHRYRGHYNNETIKGVNFFGPNSEYVISGSDCGNIFFWDKNTETILNFLPGDTMGVVNCLEPHPTIPVLATSGLDSNIKIWAPNNEKYPPDLSKLEACVRRNLRRSAFRMGDRAFQYFMREFLTGLPRHATYSNTTSSSSSSSSSSDEADSDGLDCPQMDGVQCQAQ